MIKIDSYIALESLNHYSNEIDQLQNEFINIKNKNTIHILKKNLTKSKGHFLNGAIVIEIDSIQITSLLDWDDLNLLWTGFLTMTIDYLKNDGSGKTVLSKNGLEWSIKRIKTKPQDLIVFSSKNIMSNIKNEPSKGICIETSFLQEILLSAQEFLDLRKKDSRTQNLNKMIEKYNELKKIIN
ncbi:hypothetical protein [Psychrobacillus sp.]|uniref:hypothetical protein n=1 Tax=Psychrobacillus sp. TaxID=1871623 RepID=UPI0028BE4CCC|nr:hypothetical protein [Psychrobacillus sp.]